jgi:glycosyltransferase involved in cell wall biosynthesis
MKSVCMLVQNDYEIDVRVRRKAEALIGAGYVVDVLALRSSNSDAKRYTLEGVTVYTLALGKHRGSLLRYAFEYVGFFCWAFFKLMYLMRRRGYAAIDVNTLPDFLVFAAAPAKRMGAKVVLDMHEITPEFYMSKYGIDRKSFAVRILSFIERISFNYADYVLTINEPIEKLLFSRGLNPSKSAVIMNAVDEALFAAAPIDDFRSQSGDTCIMMYHGTLTRIYGLDIAIEAFAVAQKEMPAAELWILGSGPEKTFLQALTRRLTLDSKVKFIGSVLPREIPRWLNRCDIGVLPTRQDVFLDFSFSNKLSEYIIMGKAVVVARLKTIRHYFSEDALAFFEPNNRADLAAQMVRMYRHPGVRTRFAEKAREEYKPISWAVMKKRYLSLMDKLTGMNTS